MFGLEEQRAHYRAVQQRLQRNVKPEAPQVPTPRPVRPPAPAAAPVILPFKSWKSEANTVIEEVCAKYDVPYDLIMKVDRRKMVVRPRQEVMFRMHYELMWPLSKIGRYFDKDHSTIAHSIRNYKEKNGL